mmetsp:Transcript_23226/g.34282  ORF Transcript_23226/g.34282 Transcript_23226/m.34282 type:complete len:85 (+) Transcript_23226:301-555(+)
MPNREKGANDDKFLTRQSGKITRPVNPNKAVDRLAEMPKAANKSLKVSAKTILKVSFPEKQARADDTATIQDVLVPLVFSQASA